MQEERRPVGDLRNGAVHGHLIRDAQLVGILPAVRGRAGIPGRMKDEAPGLLDLLGDVLPAIAERLGERIKFIRRDARLVEPDHLLGQELLHFLVQLLVGGMVLHEAGGIGGDLPLLEDRLVKHRLRQLEARRACHFCHPEIELIVKS